MRAKALHENFKPLMAAALVFTGCLCIGFWIARHKALWNDEYYSQIASIDRISYADQFLGRISEGGNAPLFYSLQKLFLQLIHYQTPAQWQEHWYNDASSQVLLRINPVIFMSLSMALVFYYFYRKYSWIVGFYSLFIYFSSYMLWAYWAEARPYALIVFLTTLQSVILLNGTDPSPSNGNDRTWIKLAVVNVFLSLTSILCLGEIVAASILYWVLKERDWKKYIVMTLLPIGIALFYYTHAPKYQFFFGLRPEQLIRENISRERFHFLFIFLIFLSIYFVGQKNTKLKYTPGKEILRPVPYVIFMVLVLASTAMVLCLFALNAKEGPTFPISSRYFIYLMPIGIIAATLMTVSLIKSLSKYFPIRVVLSILIAFLLLQHFFRIVPGVTHSIVKG